MQSNPLVSDDIVVPLHPRSLLLEDFRSVAVLDFVRFRPPAFSAHDAEELGMFICAIVVLGADVDELFELPTV